MNSHSNFGGDPLKNPDPGFLNPDPDPEIFWLINFGIKFSDRRRENQKKTFFLN